MKKKVLREILSTHAERLLSGGSESSDYTALSPPDQEELGTLLRVAERVKGTLVPVNPEPGFLAALERDLLQSADRRQVPNRPFWQQYVWLIVLAVAVLASAVSLAGIITYILRQRARVSRAAP
jgi:hypothetical protein